MDKIFLAGVVCCILGWVFLGLGIVFFPLSFFFLTRSCLPQAFIPLVCVGTIGFVVSLYLDSKMLAKYFF